MTLVISDEVRLFLIAIPVGMLLALVYDIFRLYRITLSYGTAAIALQDAAYCVIAGGTILLFFISESSGEIRAYALFAMALGAWMYFKTVSRVIVDKFGSFLRKFKRKMVRKMSPVALKCKNRLKRVKKHFKKLKKHSIIKRGRKKAGDEYEKTQEGDSVLSSGVLHTRLHRGSDIPGPLKNKRKGKRTRAVSGQDSAADCRQHKSSKRVRR